MRFWLLLAVLFVVLLLGACRDFAARGAQIVLRQGLGGYTGASDSHIMENGVPGGLSNYNAGAQPVNELCRSVGSGADDDKSLLFRFDVSHLPNDAQLDSGILRIVLLSSRNGQDPKTVQIHRLIDTWEEGNGNDSLPGRYDGEIGPGITGVTWNTAPSHDPTVFAENTIGHLPGEWYEFDITTLVRGWIEGTYPNNGMIVMEDVPATVNGAKLIASSDHPCVGLRPQLVLTYGGGAVRLCASWLLYLLMAAAVAEAQPILPSGLEEILERISSPGSLTPRSEAELRSTADRGGPDGARAQVLLALSEQTARAAVRRLRAAEHAPEATLGAGEPRPSRRALHISAAAFVASTVVFHVFWHRGDRLYEEYREEPSASEAERLQRAVRLNDLAAYAAGTVAVGSAVTATLVWKKTLPSR